MMNGRGNKSVYILKEGANCSEDIINFAKSDILLISILVNRIL